MTLQETLQNKVVDPMLVYVRSRSDRERTLLLLGLLALVSVIGYQCLSVLTGVYDKLAQQHQELDKIKAEFNTLLDENTSPLKRYSKLKQEVLHLETTFEQRLESEGTIASLEKVLKKYLDQKYFTLNELNSRSFGGSLQKTPFTVTFKTGSLKTVAKILADLQEGEKTFTITSLKIEKTFRKYLNVELNATSIRKGSS